MSDPGNLGSPRHAVVVADGEVPARASLDAAWPGWAEAVGWVVAADGGAGAALRLGLGLDLVVGDMDSIGPTDLARVRELGVALDIRPVDKDESDTEIALRAALERGAGAVTVLGALGGARIDHALANVWLLALPAARGRPVVLLDARSRLRLFEGPGRAALSGPAGDLVSLLPFDGPAIGVTTEALAYPLRDEDLPVGPSRGLSNVRIAPDAAVTVRAGRLLIIETRQEGAST